jgi:hypothetical protein
MNVGSYSDPQIGSPSDIFTNSITFAPAGAFALFVAHTAPGDFASITVTAETTGTGATLTHATADWDTLGFEVGDTVLVDWNGNDDQPKYGRCESLTTNVMTLVEGVGDAPLLVSGALGGGSPAGTTKGGAVHSATPMQVSGLATDCM